MHLIDAAFLQHDKGALPWAQLNGSSRTGSLSLDLCTLPVGTAEGSQNKPGAVFYLLY